MSRLCLHAGGCGRRRYVHPDRLRRCQDCGRFGRPVTLVTFWATGMPYAVCSDCIRAYREVINHPAPEWRR